MTKLGFWSDLGKVQFSDPTSTGSWVQALSIGTFSHPLYGDIEITPTRVARFAANVKAKVRGIVPSINYDHINMGEAAGWVTDAQDRPDGLWLFVEWTDPARTKIKEKLYRYFSAEFDDTWEDPKTHVKFEDVLFGGALTNRPFLKDLVPVNLSELTGDSAATPPEKKEGEGEGMDPKVLRQSLGLSESATDDEVLAKIKSLSETPPPSNNTAPPVTPPATTPPVPQGKEVVLDEQALQEQINALAQVSQTPAVKALTEMLKAQNAQLQKFQERERENAVERKLSELDKIAEQNHVAVPPATKEALKAIMLKSHVDLGDQLYNAFADTLKLGVVELGERGWSRRGLDGDANTRFADIVSELQKKNPNMSYADAMDEAARTNPQLYAEYRRDTYVVVE